jgi:hypothetical protein
MNRSELGIGKFTFLVFGSLVAGVIYVAYAVGPFFYYFYELENHFAACIRVASSYSDKELREKILYQLKWLDIPADAEDLKIERESGVMRISLPYEEVWIIEWQGREHEIYKFKFTAFAEGKF